MQIVRPPFVDASELRRDGDCGADAFAAIVAFSFINQLMFNCRNLWKVS